MKEITKPIPNYEDYEVSIWGNVYKHGKLISQNIYGGKTNKQYLRVELYKGKIHKTVRVHRLVAEAFIPNPEHKTEVNHIDGNVQNNSITNLEWVTPEENKKHRLIMKNEDYSDSLFPELSMELPFRLASKEWLQKV